MKICLPSVYYSSIYMNVFRLTDDKDPPDAKSSNQEARSFRKNSDSCHSRSLGDPDRGRPRQRYSVQSSSLPGKTNEYDLLNPLC